MFNQPIAEAIYFLQYVLAGLLWFVNRMILSIAIIAENVNTWFTDNAGYFAELMTNALSAPLGGLFILALSALGVWYLLNNVLPTQRWVDPVKLVTYSFMAFLFFSAPVWVIDQLEELRTAVNGGIDQALLASASGDIFTDNLNGSDTGIGVVNDGLFPPGEPGVGSFDLAGSFLLVSNINEVDSSEFPAEFEATYFPFGDPAGIDLSDEADQELAKSLAAEGIERQLFALFAGPTAVVDHFLRLVLTGTAVILYLGLPVAFLFAFFIYTQAFLMAYIKQFMGLLIETFMSVLIVTVMVGLLEVTAVAGLGLYLAASFITLVVVLWRIKSAFKLATRAFDLFGAAQLTGGAGGMTAVNMGTQMAVGTGMALATGGASLALTAGALGTAAALRYDQQQGGEALGTDPSKADARIAQLKAVTGYALGRSPAGRHMIEGAHELRTMGRIFRDGEVGEQEADALDYLRVGASMSGFGSSPWLAMRLSPSLRQAYDQMGGRRQGRSDEAPTYAFEYEEGGEPVDERTTTRTRPQAGPGRIRVHNQTPGPAMAGDETGLDVLPPRAGRGAARPTPSGQGEGSGRRSGWREAGMTVGQQEWLDELGLPYAETTTRGEASDLIRQATRQKQAEPRRLRVPATRPGTSEPDESVAGETGDEGSARGRDEQLALSEGTTNETEARRGRDGQTVLSGSATHETETNPAPLERGRIEQTATERITQADAMMNSPMQLTPQAPQVYLENPDPARRALVNQTLAHLAAPDTAGGQGTQATLTAFIGQANSQTVAEAVQTHGAEAVQTAAETLADRLATYRTEGHSEADILTHFQQGTALTDLSVPLTSTQQTALADLVLMPRRELGREELMSAMAEMGRGRDTDLARHLGIPTGFASYTGLVRELLSQVQALELSQSDLHEIVTHLEAGRSLVAQTDLLARGLEPGDVNPFLRNLAALPANLLVPQTTRTLRPRRASGENNE
ncbi:MAG: hypothetical protein KA314_19320 [Chloroflexi bacterium]|nr:hypothetical protein [Chloroflexota bacterium]MBP8057984.1 hypothetical protein [Chloroflexota bacterium]